MSQVKVKKQPHARAKVVRQKKLQVPESVNEVFALLEQGVITREQAEEAFRKIRYRDHTWLERQAKYLVPS